MNLDDWRSRINDLDERDPQPPQPARVRRPPHRRAQEAAGPSVLRSRARGPGPRPSGRAQPRGRSPADAIRAIWREILSASLALEHPLPVAYLGPPGTFTHQAAMPPLRLLRAPPRRAHHRRDLRRGRARPRGVRRGPGGELHRGRGQRDPRPPARLGRDDHRRDDARHRAAPHLAGRELGEVKMVCSHPQGLAQCREWLAAHLPDGGTEEIASTVGGGRAGARRRHGGGDRLRDGGAACTACRSCGAASRTTRRTPPASS